MGRRDGSKRAARACNRCRSRKVRCVSLKSSDPCVNCIHDGQHCVFAVGWKPYAKSKSRKRPSLPKPPSEISCHSPVTSRYDDETSREGQQTGTSQSSPPAEAPEKTTAGNRVDEDLTHLLDPVLDCTLYANPRSSTLSYKELATMSQPCLQAPSLGCHPGYAFLHAPNIQNILPQDLQFLRSQGCFVVPSRVALDELLQQYFRHVHPMLPLINEAHFWAIYNQQDPQSGEKISMLVLQAMLFVSSGFTSLEAIRKLGFKSLHEAKSAFYRRAKLLYDFGCELSSIAISQAALLLSHSHLIPVPLAGNKPFGSTWLAVAIHHARVVGADHYDSKLKNPRLNLPEATPIQNTLKRLWWCCIICDRLMPLTSRQRIQIPASSFNPNHHSPFRREDLIDEIYNSEVYDPSTKQQLADILEGLVDLCIVLTQVLTLTSDINDHSSSIMEAQDLEACKERLELWKNSWTRPDLGLSNAITHGDCTKSSVIPLMLFTNLVEMYFHSARLALCHFKILRFCLPKSLDFADLAKTSDELQDAASQVTDCLEELNRLRLVCCLPMTAVGCTALPLTLNLIDTKILGSRQRHPLQSRSAMLSIHRKQKQLQVLLEAMNTYKPRYYIVEWVQTAVSHVVNMASRWLSIISISSDSSLSSWTELLHLQPSFYLRLVMTVEFSISQGMLPQEKDLPSLLRTTVEGGATTNIACEATVPMHISEPFAGLDKSGDNSRDIQAHSTTATQCGATAFANLENLSDPNTETTQGTLDSSHSKETDPPPITDPIAISSNPDGNFLNLEDSTNWIDEMFDLNALASPISFDWAEIDTFNEQNPQSESVSG